MHERRGAAAIEVDRLLRAERDHQPRELAEIEPAVDAGTAPIAAHREQTGLADAKRAARIAPDRDVGIELRRAGGEALPILIVDQRAPTGHKQWPSLYKIAVRLLGELIPRRETHTTVDVQAATLRSPRQLDRLVFDYLATDPNLPKRPIRIPQEEARDDRLRLVVGNAPVVEPRRLRKMDDAYGSSVKRMADEIYGGLQAITDTHAEKLVIDAVPHT